MNRNFATAFASAALVLVLPVAALAYVPSP
jgi:hypothetical protein